MKEPLKQALMPLADKIRVAFVYGSIAKRTDTARSDIDLMTVAEDLAYSDLYERLHTAEKIVGRPINPTIVEPKEWKDRRTKRSSFIEKIGAQPKIFIGGSEADLQT